MESEAGELCARFLNAPIHVNDVDAFMTKSDGAQSQNAAAPMPSHRDPNIQSMRSYAK
jgi:hypothetical protein